MKKVLVVTGPTASGKTTLAVNLAEALNGEIISADSRQVYRHIPISTSHPPKSDLKKIKHYFIDELDPEEEFNAGEFGIKGREIIKDIFKRNKLPIVAGGSGLYIRSIIDGLFEEKIDSDEIRKTLYEKLEMHGEEYLYEELKNVDEEIYGKIPKGKIRRVIRALEVYHSTGKKMSEFHKEKVEIDFEPVLIGIMHDRKVLYERINRRVDQMLAEGLIKEVKDLMDKGMHYKKQYSLDTVGVKEVMKYFEGEYGIEEMTRLIKQNTRRYAKRQLTWFRRDERINWINSDDETDEKVLLKEAVKIFNQRK
ncbi:MAG TPA: tRNA (adenosine(37)-N6)-dimethylallyltransferase MiaA [Ignavibacteria bacterium]|nr:tRNA (adenosine(37)-N6)-dimethylallyltransferase MiaA [Ignavibacteria bacterium]HMR39634.1 tRNA (adenosine(37)-N6)-dimethylallyltransferase MiaA [Ignavibacteria bacterium]